MFLEFKIVRRGPQITATRAACGPRAASLRPLVYIIRFIADRTNGRAYARVLRLSFCRLSLCNVMYCGKTVRPRAKVAIESV